MKTLDVPFGKFWITANGEPIGFKIEDHTEESLACVKEANPRYNIEKAYLLRPKLPSHFDELNVRISTDNQARYDYDDNICDEFFYGGQWLVDDYIVAITIYVDNGYLDQYGDYEADKLPGYIEVPDSFKDLLYFQVVYKKFSDYFTREEAGFYDDSLWWAM